MAVVIETSESATCLKKFYLLMIRGVACEQEIPADAVKAKRLLRPDAATTAELAKTLGVNR